MHNAGRVLDASLPYESRPGAARRAAFDASSGTGTTGGGASTADGALAVVAHAVHDRTGKHRVAYSSAFAIAVPGVPKERAVYVTCAHTLEEVSRRRAQGFECVLMDPFPLDAWIAMGVVFMRRYGTIPSCV